MITSLQFPTRKRSQLSVFVLTLAILLAFVLSACSGLGGSSVSSASSSAGVKTLTSGVLRIGTTSDSKPYEFNADGKLQGFDIDLLNAVAAKMGMKTQFVTQDFSALLASVNNNQYDMAAASIAITNERKQLVDFSWGYLAGYLGVIALPGAGITDKASLQGKRVGVLQGSIEDTYAATYLPGAEIVRFPNVNTAFQALQNKTINTYFNDYVVDQSLQKKYPNLNLVIPVKIAATNLPAGWAVHKGNTALADALNKALVQVVKDGTWAKLYKKWFPNVPMTPLPPYKKSAGGV